MNTLTGHRVHPHRLNPRPQSTAWALPRLRVSREALIASTGMLVAVVVILLSAWAATHQALLLLGAVSVALGFLFIGLAVEARHELAAALAATGIAMPVLGAMANSVAPEFGVLAGALVAAWIVYPTLRRLVG